MRYRPRRSILILYLAALLAASLFLSGCTHLREETPISPAPIEPRPADFGLGPGVRPLSSGPGDKSSPSWGPSGDRIAFVKDGYVVEKPIDAREALRQTTRDFGAERVVWMSSGESLAVLARELPAAPGASLTSDRNPLWTVYRTDPGDSLGVSKLATKVSAISLIPNGEDLLVALRSGADAGRLVVVRENGMLIPYDDLIEGEITAISVVPDGSRAIIAARKPGPEGTFEVLSYAFSENRIQRLASLRDDLKIFGAPQWTTNGIYYVAGEETEDGTPATYSLYRLAPGSDRPELASGVGEDFIASSIKRDPEGDRLAVIGRRNSSSPLNLYIFHPGTGDLVAATTNENMEVKTATEDLAWSKDSEHVAIVARTMLSEPRVYEAPADTLVSDFYNIYQVPARETAGEAAT